MSFLHTVFSFLVAISVLVTIHELGHYWVARWCGVKVLRFSLGMGRVIFSRRIGPDQTEWVISALPLGGYVKMLDVREQGEEAIPEHEKHREFCAQSVWKRIAIVAAGPVANFLLAIILYATLFVHGTQEPLAKIRVPANDSIAYQAGMRHGDVIAQINSQTVQGWGDVRWYLMRQGLNKTDAQLQILRDGQTLSLVLPTTKLTTQDLETDFINALGFNLYSNPEVLIEKILPESPALTAGLREGDKVIAINGSALLDSRQFIETVQANPTKPLVLQVQRAAQDLSISVTPRADEVQGKTVGRLLVQVKAPELSWVTTEYDLPTAVVRASQKVWDTSILILQMLGKMLTGEVSLKNITGPLTIADYAGKTAKMGLTYYLGFLASISISLGVMNLLPIPVLDGGHLLYYSLEIFTGKPISERVIFLTQRFGMFVLAMLMALAFFNDIARLMS